MIHVNKVKNNFEIWCQLKLPFILQDFLMYELHNYFKLCLLAHVKTIFEHVQQKLNF